MDDLKAEIERLRAENSALRHSKSSGGDAREMSFKIGEKGGLSVYGLGRFPVTLYKEQWLKLLDKHQDIRNFLKENEHRLKTKE